jgi:hypothetical protein
VVAAGIAVLVAEMAAPLKRMALLVAATVHRATKMRAVPHRIVPPDEALALDRMLVLRCRIEMLARQRVSLGRMDFLARNRLGVC